jgi:hypothetical protein
LGAPRIPPRLPIGLAAWPSHIREHIFLSRGMLVFGRFRPIPSIAGERGFTRDASSAKVGTACRTRQGTIAATAPAMEERTKW